MSVLPQSPPSHEGTHPHPSRRAVVLWPWLLIALAWGVLLLATLAHQTFLLDHHYLLQASGLPWLAALEVFLLCWQLMTVAMMLPSSMPMVHLVVFAGRRQARPVAVPLAFLAGYAVIWTAFATGAFVGDTGIHRLVALWPWLAMHTWLIGAVTFVLAGLFQFSAFKGRCLDVCRAPLGFFLHYYRKGVSPAWQLGLRHGGYCLGCCWALMLVMFGVGVGNLAGMAALTGVMVLEKTVPGWQAAQSIHRGPVATARCPVVHATCLAPKCRNIRIRRHLRIILQDGGRDRV